MQTIQQNALQTHNQQNIERSKVDDNQSTIKAFTNPICKVTYTALPRIYGKKKKSNRAKTEAPKSHKMQLNSSRIGDSRRLSFTQLNNNKSVKKKQMSQRVKISCANHSPSCSKKSCECNKQLEKINSSRKKTFLSSIMGHIKLPQIQKFQLQDLQSKHKVSKKRLGYDSQQKNGLNAILYQQMRVHKQEQKKISSPLKIKENLQKEPVDGRNILKITKINFKNLKAKHKFKPKFNNAHRFDIQQQSQQQNQYQQEKLDKKSSISFKTEIKPFYPKNSHSMILNQSRFKNNKTRYTELNLRQTSTQIGSKKRKLSSKQNGVFIIPSQKEYLQYLKNYQKININFNLSNLVKKQNFRIIKGQNQVYFGQVNDEQQRHGEGINISQKQIYEGKYQNNLKLQGCERNLDGVFAGRYEDGVRSGYGMFKWYNGQYFQGSWKNGVKNGFGRWKSPKGDFYEGQWIQNRQQGKGIFRHRTSTYKGQFVNFLKHGFGQQIFANGDQYKGQYKQGKPNGKGKYQWNDGSYYEGQFHKGMRQGKGKWCVPKKFQYEGCFKRDFKHGLGKQSYPNGQKFQGQYQYGQIISGKLFDRLKNCKQIKKKQVKEVKQKL